MPGQMEAPNPVTLLAYDPVSHTFVPVIVASVTTDANNNEVYGTLSGSVSVSNGNPNGQTTMSASSPVVIASNQSPVAMTGAVATGVAVPANPLFLGMDGFGSLLQPIVSLGNPGAQANMSADQTALVATAGVGTNSGMWADQCPDVFTTASATASGNSAVWTPPAGNRFRLLKCLVQVTQNAAAAVAGVLHIQFYDAAVGIGLEFSVYIPSAAATTLGEGWTTGWIDIGGTGYRSTTANNALNINLSFALTSGEVRVIVGTNSD